MRRYVLRNMDDPTCSADDGVTELQEQVGLLLESANIPDHVNDEIMTLIARAERKAFEDRAESGLRASWDNHRPLSDLPARS